MHYPNEKNSGSASAVLVKIAAVFGGIVLGLGICRIFLLPFTVSGSSMEPNLKKGEKIILTKIGTPEKGAVILINSPIENDRVLLKRIIAVYGDTVEVRNKIIYINDQKTRFSWKTLSSDKRIFPMNFTYRDNMPAVKLQRKEFFVIGDNLDYSFDSRAFGAINEDMIVGRMIYKF
ncbi:MAG: signal peptidase I [bacterium]|nr:signal peptidase I [bacterium]